MRKSRITQCNSDILPTNALRQIPGCDKIPNLSASAIAALCHPANCWLTASVLHVDGGENIVG
jgi:hypothetical protein